MSLPCRIKDCATCAELHRAEAQRSDAAEVAAVHKRYERLLKDLHAMHDDLIDVHNEGAGTFTQSDLETIAVAMEVAEAVWNAKLTMLQVLRLSGRV
jgi:hypothetical protein